MIPTFGSDATKYQNYRFLDFSFYMKSSLIISDKSSHSFRPKSRKYTQLPRHNTLCHLITPRAATKIKTELKLLILAESNNKLNLY